MKRWLLIIGFIALIIAIPVSLFVYKQKTFPQNASKLLYSCPLDKKLCYSGEQVNLQMTKPPFFGLGYQNIASGSAILAVIPGRYSAGGSIGQSGEKNTILTINNGESNLEANYQFKGQAYIPTGVGNGMVKQGGTIGWIAADGLDKGLFSKNYQLIVSVQNTTTREFIKLIPKELTDKP